jgi:class 3 adenylate cyclase/CHASE2 domain-containing sensor protein
VVKFRPLKRIPAFIAGGVILLVCAARLVEFDFIERLERMTYDMRVREALKFSPSVSTNLGFVIIDESSIDFIRANTTLGYRAGLYWPRHIYGRLTDELVRQGATAIGFDILFGELRPDHSLVKMGDGATMESDEFFALQIRRASNVVIAASDDKLPPPLFATNALALGDISTEKDRPEGILRRTRAFKAYRKWHPAFEQAQMEYGFDLNRARIETRQIVLHRSDGDKVEVPLDVEGNFDMADFVGDKLPPGMPRKARPFVEERVWNMGIVLAARQLRLDLNRAEIDLKHGRILLRGSGGVQRVIPVDGGGLFYIDWSVPPSDPSLFAQSIQNLLVQNRQRLDGTNGLTNSWAGKLVVVGSGAQGNDLIDRGATPLSADTLLVSKHWNVANSILMNRFVRISPVWMELILIALLGAVAAFLTSQSRVLLASGLVFAVMVLYAIFGVVLFVQTRYCLPMVLPVIGGLFMNYVSLVVWRVKFEQAEVRRIKSIFGKIVSPKIMKELLDVETLSLIGVRREVSVLFSDVRGFTELTDTSQEEVAEYVRRNNLSGNAAKMCFDEQAREILSTVNVYLGSVADTIIKRDGTLDKFIGDCVMAFWGAPTANPNHAVACVRAAIEAQRSVHVLNEQRAEENKKRELENKARISAGLKPRPILPLLLLGSGINTGIATAGLMGSQSEQKNYTVFGGEVNLASRLESLSGSARIFISESTYQHLLRDDPALAASCIAQPPQKIKGIRMAVAIYEVPWREVGTEQNKEQIPVSTVQAFNSSA